MALDRVDVPVRWMVVALLILIGAAGTTAGEDGRNLAGLLDSMSSYRADFEQVVTNQAGEVLQTSTGTMHLVRPGRLRWSVDEPYPQLVVADGEHVWVYDPDLEQVTVQPFDETVEGTPAMFLTDATALDENFRVRLVAAEEGADSRFVLTPRAPESTSLFRSITVSFSPSGHLRQLDIVDYLDQATRLAFRHGVADPVLESGLFQFEVPEGVDVIGNLPDKGPTEPAP